MNVSWHTGDYSTISAEIPQPLSQTAPSLDGAQDIRLPLEHSFTDIQGPDIRDSCYATQKRQSGVRDLNKLVEVILVDGATTSSNPRRLREIGTDVGSASDLIANGSERDRDWLKGARPWASRPVPWRRKD